MLGAGLDKLKENVNVAPLDSNVKMAKLFTIKNSNSVQWIDSKYSKTSIWVGGADLKNGATTNGD